MTAAQIGAPVVIHVGEQPMDCDLHPLEPIVASSLIDGRLLISHFDIAAGTSDRKHSIKGQGKSCRAVAFSPDAKLILGASSDGCILAADCGTCEIAARLCNAHSCGITKLTFASESLLASGDDDGAVKLWDTRARESCGCFSVHTDYVSDLKVHHGGTALLATSGDGTISVSDLRTLKVIARSEDDADEELCSCAVVHGGRKIVCGSSGGGGARADKGGGILNIFSDGYWNGPSDRMTGHPSSVDCMVAIDSTTIATGCSDGFVRLVQIQPNMMLSTLGMHGTARGKKQEGSPVEALAFSQKYQVLASAGHDDTIRLWSLQEEEEQEQEQEGQEREEERDGIGAISANRPTADASTSTPTIQQSPEAAAAANESGSDLEQQCKKRKKTVKKGAHKILRGADAVSASKAAFFADL